MSNPWMKFYPRDWRGDQALRMVSVGARGLWIECLCIMHEAKPYGHLLINGRPVGDDALARIVGASGDEVRSWLAELRESGVFDDTGEGVIFSRRMVRDQERAAKGKKAAHKRWAQPVENPQETERPNRSPNGSPSSTPITQKPEARSQRKKEEPNGSSKKARGSRLPRDWVLPDDWLQWAVARGVPEARSRVEAEKFRNYWTAKAGKDAAKLDWRATWHNWIIKVVEGLPRPETPQSSGIIDLRPNRAANGGA